MKSLIALFLAMLLLGSSILPIFSLDQSAKWAEVLQHYQQHRREKPALGFTEFMAMHYGAGSTHRKHHHHSHQNLPATGHAVALFSPQPLRLVTVTTVELVKVYKAVFFRKADMYSFLASYVPLNPPRA